MKRNDTEAVGAVHLPVPSYMHYGSLTASDVLLRWSFGTNLSKPLPLGSLNSIAPCAWNYMRPLGCGLILCRGITEQPLPQLGTCSAQQNRWVFLVIAISLESHVQLRFLCIFHVAAFGFLDLMAEN